MRRWKISTGTLVLILIPLMVLLLILAERLRERDVIKRGSHELVQQIEIDHVNLLSPGYKIHSSMVKERLHAECEKNMTDYLFIGATFPEGLSSIEVGITTKRQCRYKNVARCKPEGKISSLCHTDPCSEVIFDTYSIHHFSSLNKLRRVVNASTPHSFHSTPYTKKNSTISTTVVG